MNNTRHTTNTPATNTPVTNAHDASRRSSTPDNRSTHTHSERRETLVQTAPPIEATAAALKRPIFPGIRWGAVLAGVVIGISVQMALTLLGIATGLTALGAVGAGGVGTGSLIWAGVTLLLSAFAAGYVAARMSGLKRKSDGVLHGAVSWAVTTILFAVLATSIGGSLVSGVFNNLSQLAQAGATASAGAGSGGSPIAELLRQQLGNVDGAALKQLQQALGNGQRDQAIQILTTQMGVDPNRAQQIADQALILSGSPEAASPQARESAGQALQDASKAAWGMFGAVALALLIGIVGGAIGVKGSSRKVWGEHGGAAAAQ